MGRNSFKVKKSRFLLLIPVFIFFCLFYFYPLLNILFKSFQPDKIWSQTGLDLFSAKFYLSSLRFTIYQAIISTLITLLIALPIVFVFTKYKFPCKNILKVFITIPFILPSMVVAASFESLLGINGLLNQLLTYIFELQTPMIRIDKTMYFFILAQIFYNTSIMFHIISRSWSSMPRSLTESSNILGATKLKTFLKVNLPLLMPSIITSSIIVFTFCFTCFGIVMILGGGHFATLGVEIFRQAAYLFNLPVAAILSIIQILFSFGVFLLLTFLQKKTTVELKIDAKQENFAKKPATIKSKIFIFAMLCFILAFFASPLISLILRSFHTGEAFYLGYYTGLFKDKSYSVFSVPPIDAIYNSITIASITVLISVVMGIFTATYLAKANRKFLNIIDSVLMLPFTTSAVILGLGIVLIANEIPMFIRDSIILLSIVHTLMAFPFVLRALLPALSKVPQNLRESAAILGANSRQVWRKIDLPVIEKAIATAAVFAFMISTGEFGASSFIAKPNTPTMTTAIHRLLTATGAENYGQAMAMSVILMLVTIFGAVIISRSFSNRYS